MSEEKKEDKIFDGPNNIKKMLEFIHTHGNHKHYLQSLYDTVDTLKIKEACGTYISHTDGNGNAYAGHMEYDSGVIAILTVLYIDLKKEGKTVNWFELLKHTHSIDSKFLEYSMHQIQIMELNNMYLTLTEYTEEELSAIAMCSFNYSDLTTKLNKYKTDYENIMSLLKLYNDLDKLKLSGCTISDRRSPPNIILHNHNRNTNSFGYGFSKNLQALVDSLIYVKKGIFVSNVKMDDGVISFEFYQEDQEDMSYTDFKDMVMTLLDDYKKELEDTLEEIIKPVREWYLNPMTTTMELVKYINQQDKEKAKSDN